MKCKDIEALFIESSGRMQDLKQFTAVHLHVADCSKCAHLIEEVESMRGLLQRRAEPELPGELDKKTYQLCKSELYALQKNKKKVNLQQQLEPVPVHMKIVFISLLVLTVIWIVPFFKDFGLDGEALTLPAIMGLFLIIQNAVLLIFSPLLIRRFRSKKNQHTIYSIGG